MLSNGRFLELKMICNNYFTGRVVLFQAITKKPSHELNILKEHWLLFFADNYFVCGSFVS